MSLTDEDEDVLLLQGQLQNEAAAAAEAPPQAPRHRRRIILEDDDERTAAERSINQLEEDDDIADILRQGIPANAKTPKGDGIGALERDLWEDCDRGMAAQRRLTGTHVNWSASQRIVFIIMQLVPVNLFAPEIYEWNKTKHTTLIKLASTYATMRPQTTNTLIEATESAGEVARELIDRAKQQMFGSEAIHDIAVYALMIYWWATHEKSKKHEIIDNAIDDYLRTADSSIDELLAASKKGTYLNIDDDQEAIDGVWKLPGMRRLNYQESRHFTKAWLDLWTHCINLLCFKEVEKTDIGEVNKALASFTIDSMEHPDARQPKSIHLIHAGQRQKFMRTAELCKRADMSERIPNTFQRAINFLCAIDDPTFRKLETIVEDDDTIVDSDITYKKTVELAMLAESRIKKRISTIAMAKKIRDTGKKPRVKENKDKTPPTGDGKGTAPKPDAEKNADRPLKKLSKHTFLLLPAEMKGLSKEENKAISDKHNAARVCRNCGEFDKNFPKHRSGQCPYESRFGYPRTEDHIPVRPLSEKSVAAPALQIPEEDNHTEIMQGCDPSETPKVGFVHVTYPVMVNSDLKRVEPSTTNKIRYAANAYLFFPIVCAMMAILTPAVSVAESIWLLFISACITCFSCIRGVKNGTMKVAGKVPAAVWKAAFSLSIWTLIIAAASCIGFYYLNIQETSNIPPPIPWTGWVDGRRQIDTIHDVVCRIQQIRDAQQSREHHPACFKHGTSGQQSTCIYCIRRSGKGL